MARPTPRKSSARSSTTPRESASMSEQTATWFNHYDARPEVEVPAESPLAWSYHKSGRPAVSQKSRVVLRERAMLGHLILRGGAIVLEIGRASCRERV